MFILLDFLHIKAKRRGGIFEQKNENPYCFNNRWIGTAGWIDYEVNVIECCRWL